MRIRSFFPILLVFLFLFACTSPKQKLNNQISSLENSLFSETSSMIDENKTLELVNSYIEYADKFPEDTNSVNYLFKAADISMNLLDPNRSIRLFDRIMTEYPDYIKIPHCLFLKGYVYENSLRNLDAAKALYLAFLDRYPQHEFADDVAISLQHLGKTPEQLIEEFQAKQEADSIQ